MPIYAYKCESCGFAKDVLQKMSDSPLAECPTCGASAFRKQLTAAGFQLKGSGWYATDFKGAPASSGATADTSTTVKPAADSASSTATTTKTDSPAASATGGCGGGCACH